MKDRILFFILGAVLATAAYFIGDMNLTETEDPNKVFEGDVEVRGKLLVTGGSLSVVNLDRTLNEPRNEAVIFAGEEITALMLMSNIRNAAGGTLIIGDEMTTSSTITLIASVSDMGRNEGLSILNLSGNNGNEKWVRTSND